MEQQNTEVVEQSQVDEATVASNALYFSGRLAYNPRDTSRPIGRYNAQGEVIPFATHFTRPPAAE